MSVARGGWPMPAGAHTQHRAGTLQLPTRGGGVFDQVRQHSFGGPIDAGGRRTLIPSLSIGSASAVPQRSW